MRTSSISQLFEAVQTVIYNTSKNEELQKQLNSYGFTPKRMQEGSNLLKQARQLQQNKNQHYVEKRRVSTQITQDRQSALELFKDHVLIAKTAFHKSPDVILELGIRKRAKKSWDSVLQAQDFYQKVPAYMEKLQQYGADQAQFQQNEAAIEALLTLKAERLKKKGDAEHSTQVKDQTIKALRAWYGEFRKLARIAFHDTPQVLETFGIVILSAKRKHKETAEEQAVAAHNE